MNDRRAIIFVNGKLPDGQLVSDMLSPDDFLVAANGGLNHMRQLQLKPDLVIGDLDSLSKTEKDDLCRAGTEIEQSPVEKNETDLELAIHAVLQRGFNRIMIVAALGGRLDQILANTFLLALPELSNCDVRMDDGMVEVLLIRDTARIQGKKDERISLIPFGQPAKEVSTEGLYYKLENETLQPYHTRGISNVMAGEEATVVLGEGCLICVHLRN